jgi:hypothetical protein
VHRTRRVSVIPTSASNLHPIGVPARPALGKVSKTCHKSSTTDVLYGWSTDLCG